MPSVWTRFLANLPSFFYRLIVHTEVQLCLLSITAQLLQVPEQDILKLAWVYLHSSDCSTYIAKDLNFKKKNESLSCRSLILKITEMVGSFPALSVGYDSNLRNTRKCISNL